jgi:uncharacterized membrane protein YjjP (DUF1212 family)
MDKYTFGAIGIICFVALQIVAWILGYDGQVFTFSTSAISGILMFLTGVNLTEQYYKKH